MFAEFLIQNEFYNQYINLFANRFTMGSLRVENYRTDLTSKKRAIEIYNNMKAIKDIISSNPSRISPYDSIDIADTVNKRLKFYDKGFRKINVEVNGAPFIPVEPEKITEEMYSLFDCYHNVWNILNPYEREARFHIKFIRIHPFEDGNGRTGRILTSYNLCKANKAPIIINSKERKKYFEYINNNNIDGLTKFFERKSKEELEVMLELYTAINGDEIKDIENTNDEDIKIYELVRNRRKG